MALIRSNLFTPSEINSISFDTMSALTNGSNAVVAGEFYMLLCFGGSSDSGSVTNGTETITLKPTDAYRQAIFKAQGNTITYDEGSLSSTQIRKLIIT